MRRAGLKGKYSLLRPFQLAIHQERQSHLVRHLHINNISSLSGLKILDVGCGSGSHLLEFIQLGSLPIDLAGCDLLLDRIDEARHALHGDIALHNLSADMLPYPEHSFDICYLSLVFSSILSDNARKELAMSLMRLIRPGGLVLIYDFYRDNPFNPDVKPLRLAHLKRLFPNFIFRSSTLTVIPPLARVLPTSIAKQLYSVLTILPFIHTHHMISLRPPLE